MTVTSASTESAVVHLCISRLVVDDDLGGQRDIRGGAGPDHAAADLEPSIGAVKRLALLAREQFGEPLSRMENDFGALEQPLSALREARSASEHLRDEQHEADDCEPRNETEYR